MKVRIKNNRLALDNQVLNLKDVSDDRLKEIASRYQIGTSKKEIRQIPFVSRGRATTRSQETLVPKTRIQIENEIRSILTIVFFVPRSMWTEEQIEIYTANDLYNEKDISRIDQVLESARVRIKLPPYEKTSDLIKEATMLADVTEDMWDHLKETFCKKYKRIKDDDGNTLRRRKTHVNRLLKVEFVPETDADRKRLEELEAKEEEKTAKKK